MEYVGRLYKLLAAVDFDSYVFCAIHSRRNCDTVWSPITLHMILVIFFMRHP